MANHTSYPATTAIHQRCLNMLADLFHAPCPAPAIGTSTIGSSEAILLAVLALKRRWLAKHPTPPMAKPNLIMSTAVHVSWKKAASYFNITPRYVPCTITRWTLDPLAAVSLIDDSTIGICAILGTTYTGEYEDVKALNDVLVSHNLDVPIHVDAASGGFVAPFVQPELAWDFRLEKVVSINVSGHKYGLVYAGVGWVVWRGEEDLPRDMVMGMNYLGAKGQTTFTLNFSRGASHVVGQYFRLVSLGREGYRKIMLDLVEVAGYLGSKLDEMGCFVVLSGKGGAGLPVVVFRLDPKEEFGFDEFAIAMELRRKKGWMVPAYTMAPNAERLSVLRVVVREGMSVERCDELVADLEMAVSRLVKTPGSGQSKI
ncbi:hypothetical protein OQA88_2419 [Cercophora sp. LCS_1]